MRARPLLSALAVTSALLLSAAPAVAQTASTPADGAVSTVTKGTGGTQSGTSGTQSGTSGTQSGTRGTQSGTRGTQSGTSSGTTTGSKPFSGTPLAGAVTQLQNGLSSGGANPSSAPDVQGGLTTLTTCLSAISPAGGPSSLVAGQTCIQNFFKALGVAQADCFSKNGFTATTLTNALKNQTPPDLATMVQRLLSCLMPAATNSSAPPSTGGGGGSTPPVASTGTAPAATPVAGTPTFTG